MEHEERLKAALADRYQIEREIGSGGMATVYLAQDLKHDRKVAVKVLKPELAAVMGTERFLAEIRTTANLQHPHILPLFDSGETDGFLFYVMPYVEGESLRQKLERDGQLPVEEAIRIAGHVADALDHAHRHEVIHRDVKPANILFHEGEPVVSDFGIALAVSAAGEGRITETGLSLGTPYYMSPEQAAGDQTPTAASDVYSLGCVLYEMLTGDPPHTGASAQAVLGKILLGEVTRPTKLRRTIPANVEGALLKSLERLPADRFESAAGLAEGLKDKGFRYGIAAGEGAGSPPWRTIALGLAALAFILASALAWFSFGRPEESHQVVRFRVPLQRDQQIFAATGTDVTLSPDGSRIVYVGVGGEEGFRLWQRSLNQLEPSPIPGTESGSNPAFSPDGTSIAFISDPGGTVKTVSLVGGEPFPLVQEGASRNGLDWGSDRMLYFSDTVGIIRRVPETGGGPGAFAIPGPSTRYTAPDVLPDGKGLLVTINGAEVDGGAWIGVVGPGGGTAQALFPGNQARFLEPGFLLFSSDGDKLFATGFDLDGLVPTTPPVMVVDGLAGLNLNFSEFAVSESGSMVYRANALNLSGSLVWVSRDGEVRELDPPWAGNFINPRLSLDGRKLTVVEAGSGLTLWVRDLERGTGTRLRSSRSSNGFIPTWSSDGRSVTYSSGETGGRDLWTIRSDGIEEPELTLDIDSDVDYGIWSDDGEWLVFQTASSELSSADLFAVRTGEDSSPVPLAATEFVERAPSLSPDGRFLAYVSNESGRAEVYVTPFPSLEWREPVSRNGGWSPVWGDTGEIFFRSADGYMRAVRVTTAPAFSFGQEETLFFAGEYLLGQFTAQYDVSPGSERFLMRRASGTGALDMIFVGDFAEEVAERVGG